MEDRQFRYRIGGGRGGILPTLLMTALFGGLAAWLYREGNGAFLFALIFAALTGAVLLVVLYRKRFFRVLVGEKGFYYRSSPFNGRFIPYEDVQRAWITDGTAQNGAASCTCAVALEDGSVIRFFMSPDEEEAAAYLVEQAEAKGGAHSPSQKYVVDGKPYGRVRIVIAVILLAVVSVFAAAIVQITGQMWVIVPGVVTAAAVLWTLVIRFLFFRVEMGEEGFFCRTRPWDGRFYSYREIASCERIRKVVRSSPHHGSGGRKYAFYFRFTDRRGKSRQFLYEDAVHGQEIRILQERIEAAGIAAQ